MLQKRELELAVLSSYQWDEEWLLAKVDVARTRVVLVAFAADEAQRREMRANVPAGRIRFCFPPMAQPPVAVAGAMHSKLLLLKYEAYVRVVVPTGNLMSFDWGETGTMENVRFFSFPFFSVVGLPFAAWLKRGLLTGRMCVSAYRWSSSSTSPSCRLPRNGKPSNLRPSRRSSSIFYGPRGWTRVS